VDAARPARRAQPASLTTRPRGQQPRRLRRWGRLLVVGLSLVLAAAAVVPGALADDGNDTGVSSDLSSEWLAGAADTWTGPDQDEQLPAEQQLAMETDSLSGDETAPDTGASSQMPDHSSEAPLQPPGVAQAQPANQPDGAIPGAGEGADPESTTSKDGRSLAAGVRDATPTLVAEALMPEGDATRGSSTSSRRSRGARIRLPSCQTVTPRPPEPREKVAAKAAPTVCRTPSRTRRVAMVPSARSWHLPRPRQPMPRQPTASTIRQRAPGPEPPGRFGANGTPTIWTPRLRKAKGTTTRGWR
jgi:hypothetical protein